MVKQCLMGKYMAWLNVQLRKNDMHLLWQAEIVTDIALPEGQEIIEGEHAGRAMGGLSRDLLAHGTEVSPGVSVAADAQKDESQQAERPFFP